MSESSPAKLVALLHEALPSLQAMDEGDAEMSWAMFLADEIVANRAALSSWQRLALLVRETLDMDVHSDALPASLPTLFDKLTAAGILPSAAKSTEVRSFLTPFLRSFVVAFNSSVCFAYLYHRLLNLVIFVRI